MSYLILCSLIWGFSYGLIKGNLVGLNPDLLAWLRLIIPFCLFAPLIRMRNLRVKEILYLFLIGAIQYGFMYLFVIRAYQYLPAYQIVLFTACTPIYVTLIDDGLSKKFQPFYLCMAALSLIGASIFYLNEFSWSALGKGFVLVQCADICFALGQVLYRRLKVSREVFSDKNVYALLFLGGSLITAFATASSGGWQDLFALSPKQSYIILYLGAIASGLCFFWWGMASNRVSVGSLAVMNNLKTPFGILISLLFFQEKANLPLLMFSCLLIGGSLLLSERYGRRKQASLRLNPEK